MISQLQRAAEALFPAEGSMVGNVKFFTINNGVTAEDLAEQMNRADAQISTGEAVLVENVDGDLTA